MAKRCYKLQEFVAHASSVSCLSIGKKSRRLLLTGGDDHKVNLWAIGKPTSLLSLSGHTSSVESVTFDSTEVLIVSGASAGTIKLWDLEEAKIIRTLNGHRTNCSAVEFHPFGEFFASGSSDTNLKIWDVRKKGCIHTYKGHTRRISTIKFTPDGRWVVSGGMDNIVKVWDLTAGKLLHEFKFHEGPIRCIDFHPLEFLLATGSADRTVKFWDLETFELIGSAGSEATGVQSMTFHPDGRTLFCGLEDSLKVFSWEPVICHDAVDVGWSTLGDLTIHEGKLLGCSCYRNSVGIWVADTGLIGPYGVGISPVSNGPTKQQFNLQERHSIQNMGSNTKSNSGLLAVPHESETTEIRNIYVDTSDSRKTTPKRVGSFSAPKVAVPMDPSEFCNPSPKKASETVAYTRSNSQVTSRHFSVPVVVPRNNSSTENAVSPKREFTATERTNSGMLCKPTHLRRQSSIKYEVEQLSMASESGSFRSKTNELDIELEPKFHFSFFRKDEDTQTSKGHCQNMRSVAENVERRLSPDVPLSSSSHENCPETPGINKGMGSLKLVNGVQPGRTRSLVERWEKREKYNTGESLTKEKLSTGESLTMNASVDVVPETHTFTEQMNSGSVPPARNSRLSPLPSEPADFNYNHDVTTVIPLDGAKDLTSKEKELQAKAAELNKREQKSQTSESKLPFASDNNLIEDIMQNHDILLTSLRSRLTKLQVVRHFWQRSDVKGGISAVGKLPDHSVQADVVSVLMEKMDFVTLDTFSCLLPLISGLLNSQIDRHTSVSLEILLKLVAIFGPVIHSTISATPSIGVDLQAERRRECCNQCFIHLQKIKQILPSVIRRGGLVAKCAQELNLVLQES